MGYSYPAYHFYGAHVPQQWFHPDSDGHPVHESDRLDALIESLGLGDHSATLGTLMAGQYDQHMLFLCIRINGMDTEIELGEFRLSPQLPVTDEWDRALRTVAGAAGYELDQLVTGWIAVPSCI